jgi:spore germination cell wall hydrolase CwlJ-like protein
MLGILQTVLLILFLLFPKISNENSAVQAFYPSDKACMAVNLFFEAGGEGKRGMQAVAAVTYNRSEHWAYKGSICNVVLAPRQFSWTHQKGYTSVLKLLQGDTSELSAKDTKSYNLAVDIASRPRIEFTSVLPKNVLFYHSVKVKPYWVKNKVQVAHIGNHLFYKGKV